MDQERWIVVALQLDLLDNRPAVSVRNTNSGEVMTVNPLKMLDDDLETNRESLYAAGYLHGYADRHFDPAIGSGVWRMAEQLRFSGVFEECRREVPGG